ncbi:Methyltransferase FkbM family [uncultured Desulfatiglans sp.]|nr:Methyltransferase FkbM family [uncultured Desulfatiglans sp.]
MRWKSKVRKLAERLTGTHIYRVLPRGIDFASDIAYALPMYRANVVFDVGANIGQSAKIFLEKFPTSHIFCFEPVTDTYHLLQHAMQNNKRVNCFQLAFASSKQTRQMILQGSPTMFFMLGQSSELPNKDAQMESVNVDTLDDFCRMNSFDHISYLKIDTEGGDLDVLKGAAMMLTEQKIDIVQVEAGMNPNNTRHVSFLSIRKFLESYRYFLFGIYEQVPEWPTGEPHLRRINPIFVSQQVIQNNRIFAKS